MAGATVTVAIFAHAGGVLHKHLSDAPLPGMPRHLPLN